MLQCACLTINLTARDSALRICSLLPSGTEILFALGLGEQIIGVTDLCDYPSAAKDVRVVCRSRIDPSVMSSEEVEAEMHRILAAGESPYDLDVEWLNQTAPDLVLTQDLCYFCEVDAGTVRKAVDPIPDPPQVLNLNPRTLDEILGSFLEVGDACGSLRAGRCVGVQIERTHRGCGTEGFSRASPPCGLLAGRGKSPRNRWALGH